MSGSDDLLADAAIERGEGLNGDDSLALTAAAASLALGAAETADGRMPASLRAQIEANAAPFFAPPLVVPMKSRAWQVAAYVGWIAAAASWLVVASIAWKTVPRKEGEPARSTGWVAALTASDHPLAQGAKGEMSWDPVAQSGVLRINGLAVVDPKKGAYQLWIFDARRDQRYPVDGGTFTIRDDKATTIVPVKAKLPVDEPTLFAITLEPPGGVVVSDRQRIMLTAKQP
jgi:hypothetical protein